MTLKSKVASALSFAHRAGLSTKAAKAEDDEEKKKDQEARADDEDEDDSEEAKAEDDRKDDDDKKSSKKAKAKADDDGDADAEEEEESDDDEKRESAKSARRAERARCSAIVAHGVKTNQVVHACAYAFDTNMSSKAAIATLDANVTLQARSPQASSLAGRMANVKTPVVAPSAEAPEAGTPQALAAMILSVGAKAAGGNA